MAIAKPQKKPPVDVWMLSSVRGEEKDENDKPKALPSATKQKVSAGFAISLIAGKRAEPYDGQDKRAKAKKEKAE